MTETKVLALETLELDKIRELIRSPGPCVTLLVPGYRPGEQAKPPAALVRSDLQEAARQLAQRGVPETIVRDLLEPLERLAGDPDLSMGSHWGRVIFRSADAFRQFSVTEPVKPSLHVGGFFEIRPILTELHLPAEFFLLCLSKKDVEVFRCAGLRAERVRLPGGAPETLEEALGFKPPDHDLENRAASGSATGAMHAVRFGTGAGREREGAYLADFYKAVDRGVREMLGAASEAPLVLAGVEEDTALYRITNKYPNLLARNVQGAPGSWMEHDILLQAYSIVRSDCAERAVRALQDSKERAAPARFSSNLPAILRLAEEGRVSSLYVDEAARMYDVFEGRDGSPNWGEEDLLNIAAVKTMLQGGRAFRLPIGRIPDGGVVAAVLRF